MGADRNPGMNDQQWFALHDEYLATPNWRARRDAVLLRDYLRGGCQARLATCTVRAEEVHHLTYRHWRNEPLFELIAVCRPCHQELTRMDRQNRNRPPDARATRSELGRTTTLEVEHERMMRAERSNRREAS